MIVTKQITLNTTCDCAECGTPIFMTLEMNTHLRNNHSSFYCLNGHRQHYPGESAEEKLRKSLREKEAEATRREQALVAEKRLREAAQRDLKNVNARIKAGVCPCCSRTFKQLAAHMKRKHPETP